MHSLGHTIGRGMNVVDRYLLLLAQLVLAAMVAVTFVSVVGRTFFNWSVPDDMIMAEFLMVALVFLPLGWVQSQGGHLEVTVLTDLLPNPVVTFLVSVGLALGLIMFSGMTYLSFLAAWEAYVWGELAYASVLFLREWPAKMLIPIGLSWWCLRMLLHLLWPSTRPAKEDSVEKALEETEHYEAPR